MNQRAISRLRLLVTTLSAAWALVPVIAQEWRDPSPHRVQFVAVEDGVRLEVLDWGGSGRAVVLLAGSGNTAHVFDDFAPKLTRRCHVYAVTRRGYGASSQPPAGYDNQRLADDVVRVLDALALRKPVLAGHSMAGGELTTVGRQHPDRVGGLIYLDALGDPGDWPANDPAYMDLARQLPSALQGPPPPSADEASSITGFRAWQLRHEKYAFPEAELRQTHVMNADGTMGRFKTPRAIHEAIGQGAARRDYSGIRVPVLALYEFPQTGAAAPGTYTPKTPEERAAIEAYAHATAAYVDRWRTNLLRSVPEARMVDLPGAGHLVFLTRSADVLREIEAFVARLPD